MTKGTPELVNEDFAVLTLEHTAVNFGEAEFPQLEPNLNVEGEGHIFGYPLDYVENMKGRMYEGKGKYYLNGEGDVANFDIISQAGMSGSPIFSQINGKDRVIGIHHGKRKGHPVFCLSGGIIKQIERWKNMGLQQY